MSVACTICGEILPFGEDHVCQLDEVIVHNLQRMRAQQRRTLEISLARHPVNRAGHRK